MTMPGSGASFISEVKPRESIISEFNHATIAPAADVYVDGKLKLRGRVPRDRTHQPHGAMAGARIDIPIIPRSQWAQMIQDMESSKTRLSDLESQRQFPSLDQNGTNYCWCNAVVTCLEFLQLHSNASIERLSPASVAAQVKGYSNSGGWGGEALEFMVSHGITTVDKWPANAIQRSYLTDAMKADALKRKVTEWYDLEENNFDQVMTLLLNRIPVAAGLDWWSHEVAFIDPVVVSPGKYGVRFRNSWSDSYGDRGYNILTESRATPADACAPLVLGIVATAA
jgi:hypothetical protein